MALAGRFRSKAIKRDATPGCLYVPADRLEKWRDEVHASLGFGVVLRKTVVLVGFKFVDDRCEFFRKARARGRQTESPILKE